MLLFILGIVIFIAGLVVSVALHELGHLTFAKIFGVKVSQYMVGFGKTIWSIKRGETEYGIKPILLGGRLIPVAVSIGVSIMRDDTRDPASLLSEADFAMYTAKRAGKGRREVYDATADSIAAPTSSR